MTERGPRVAGVAGWPVAHSLSPRLHRAWLNALGLEHAYGAFAVSPDRALTAFQALPMLGIAGLNVTLPHKEVALRAADQRSALAEAVGAANLLTAMPHGGLLADNTDVAGVRYALRDTPQPSRNDQAVVLGAGGAARAIVFALLELGWRRLALVNRSADRAESLADVARGWPFDAVLSVHPWDERQTLVGEAGVVANATSLGMTGQPPLAMTLERARSDAVVFDSVYTPLDTPLLRAARRGGLFAVDGLDMLIGQAIPSFEAFFGVAPPESVDARGVLLAALAERETTS